MSTKLFVGGLNFKTTEEDLEEAFAEFGEVESAKIITHKDGDHAGKSRGFGFVAFVEKSDAETAIAELDNTELGGRTIRVNLAEEREGRSPRR